MSSPPSANIDPQLYNKTPKIKSKGKSKNSDEEFRLTPNFTGWTPLVSKTNEFPVNANGSTNNNPTNGIGNGTTLTPSSKFLNNILVNFNNQQYTNSDIDYSNGLNLTPFLNHNLNLNLLNSNSINHIINHQLSSNSNSNSTTNLNNLGNNLNNVANNNNANNVGNTSGVNSNLSGISYTPFHDKSLLLTDFFIDSPIRSSKDLSTITPSKFLTNDKSKKPSIFQDPKSSQKLNIKSFTTEKPNNDETDDETDDENKLPSKKRKFNFQTPSKILNDITHHQNKLKRTPVKDNNTVFVTPDKPLHNSSPSTVILSSDTKGNNIIVPNSPTPNKDFKPVMGTFSDGNNNHSSNSIPSLTNASASASTGSSNNPSTKNTGSTVKNKLTATPTNLPIKTSIINTNHGTRFKPSNRAQMQAGMNKFQIVLNDSNGVKRGRKSRKNYNANNKLDANNNSMNKNNLNKRQKKDKKSMPANVPIPTPEPAVGTVAVPGPVPVPVPMPVAVTMSDVGNNTGKSPNSMISNNFSNLTDQTSFLSTPNKNFNFFEKSPNSSLLNQLMMNNYMLPPKSANAVNANTNTNGNILNNNINAHDSGPNGQINSQMLMMMMMSTPNNQNIYQFSPSMNKVSNLEINDLRNHHNDSTTNKNEDDNDNGKNEGNVSLSAFSYFNGKSK